MSAIIESINNLGWKVTNNAIASVMGMALDTLQSKLANNGRDEKVKFYWDYDKGGSVWNILARTIVGGAVDAVSKEAMNQYKTLIGGKKADIANSSS